MSPGRTSLGHISSAACNQADASPAHEGLINASIKTSIVLTDRLVDTKRDLEHFLGRVLGSYPAPSLCEKAVKECESPCEGEVLTRRLNTAHELLSDIQSLVSRLREI